MTNALTTTRARALTDRREIQPILERDRIWAAYALGDLDDGMYEQCEWYATDDALALIFRGLNFIPLFTMGSTVGLEAILGSALIPPTIYLNQRPEHLPAIEKFYQLGELHRMWRMALKDFQPVDGEVVHVGMDRLAELQTLYRTDNGADAFAPFQLATGYFYGVERDGQLVSAAGVHLASRAYRVGAVGNVFTHPNYRGRGFATVCTSAVASALRADGIATIILNVEQRNRNAIRVYERLGFVRYCEFIEGVAKRK